MNKSLVQFTPTDGLISSGDPDCPNRLSVIMSTSVFIWDFSPAFIEAERQLWMKYLKKKVLGTLGVIKYEDFFPCCVTFLPLNNSNNNFNLSFPLPVSEVRT